MRIMGRMKITRAAAGLLSIAMLGGCGSSYTDGPVVPPETALQSGDCHLLATDHQAQAAFQDIDAENQQKVFQAAYDDCRQWHSAHTGSAVQQTGP